MSENMSSGSVCGGTIQPAAIQASSEFCSRWARIKNSWTLIMSGLQVAARILLLAGLPALRKFLDLRIELLRQHDLKCHVFVAMALVGARGALAFEPQHGAGIRGLRDGHADRPGRGGDVELRAQHRFRQTDRQLEVDVVALASEERVRPHLDLDQSIAG